MNTYFGFLDLGAPELIIVLAIILLLFGGKKLPQLSKSLGDSMRELRKGLNGSLEDDKQAPKDGKDAPDKDEVQQPREVSN